MKKSLQKAVLCCSLFTAFLAGSLPAQTFQKTLKPLNKKTAESADLEEEKSKLSPEDLKELKVALSQASAVSTIEFERIARRTPRFSAFENQPLTVLILTGIDDHRGSDDLITNDMVISPRELLKLLDNGHAELSVLQAKFLKSTEAYQQGDFAFGKANFDIPRLCSGKIIFAARRVEKKWQVLEFAFPGLGWTTSLQKEGRWRAKKKQPDTIDLQKKYTTPPKNQPAQSPQKSTRDNHKVNKDDQLSDLSFRALLRDQISELRKLNQVIIEMRLQVQEASKKNLALEKELLELKHQNEVLTQKFEASIKELAETRRLLHVQAAKLTELDGHPPQPVDGQIVKAEKDLVVLSIGSDAGLKKGMHLEVFRPAEAKYLGTLTIVAVQPDKSVGKMSRVRDGMTVKVGDRVASELDLLGRRRPDSNSTFQPRRPPKTPNTVKKKKQ